MSRIKEASKILASLGLPRAQQNERSALTLLALANVGPKTSWKDAESLLLRTVDVMAFMRKSYHRRYAPNTRETIRRQTLHQFVQARIVDQNPDDPTRPTNSGKNVYALTPAILPVVRAFGTPDFALATSGFIEKYGSLQDAYQRGRASRQVPLRLPSGATVFLSPGKHNQLQVKIIQEFGPRFAPGAEVLYVGDTAKKYAVHEATHLARLRVPITRHEKLPDIVLYSAKNNWLYLIEAVHTHGPVSPKRHRELETILAHSATQRIYVTAFLDLSAFRKYAGDIAWETEVWIAEQPDHLIHFNGPKFLGPYGPRNKH